MNKLRFKVASYDIEGNFLGFEDMLDQLFVCEVGDQELVTQFKIGSSVKKTCLFDLITLTNKLTYPRNTNIFYDLFLVDANEDLIDVPVRINGEDILYRRFFILDTLSGLEDPDAYVKNGKANYLRYAKSVTITVTLDQNIPERIFVPVLDITYEAVRTKDIETSDDLRYP